MRIDRLCIYIFMFGFAMQTACVHPVTMYTDELCTALFGALALLDCIVNHAWRRYSFMWAVMGVVTLYAIYSLTLPYNTLPYIVMDWVITLKPYIPFFIFLAINPRLTQRDRKIFRIIAIANCVLMTLTLMGGKPVIEAVTVHITYTGLIIFISALVILWTGIDENGKIPRHILITAVIFLTIGLACTRAKYYGSYVICLFFLFYYRPGMLKNARPVHYLAVVALLAVILLASWQKFNYYYLTGNSEKFDPTVAQTFARPVLYATSGLILIDHIPFGTGLASFATFASAANYSNVYYEYGIDKVWGLSPSRPDFIADAFFASLAQFGIVGLILFIWLWCHIYSYLRRLIRFDPTRYRYPFVIGVTVICFVMIENTSGNTFTQAPGLICMCLLGMVCAPALRIKQSSLPPKKPKPLIKKKI